MTVKEAVDIINAAKIYTPHSVEDVIDMADMKEIATIEQDEHRWYVLGTVVFQAGNEFFGVRGPISLKSENMGYDDVLHVCEAFEMVQVPSVTYSRKI